MELEKNDYSRFFSSDSLRFNDFRKSSVMSDAKTIDVYFFAAKQLITCKKDCRITKDHCKLKHGAFEVVISPSNHLQYSNKELRILQCFFQIYNHFFNEIKIKNNNFSRS